MFHQKNNRKSMQSLFLLMDKENESQQFAFGEKAKAETEKIVRAEYIEKYGKSSWSEVDIQNDMKQMLGEIFGEKQKYI